MGESFRLEYLKILKQVREPRIIPARLQHCKPARLKGCNTAVLQINPFRKCPDFVPIRDGILVAFVV